MENFTFSSTPFIGYENEVLELLHRNRDEIFTKEYLQWRYLGEPSAIPPVLFWVCSETGRRIGMCSFIFRKYWINGKPIFFAVAGDTSLDEEYRGKGLAKKLFHFMNGYLEQNGLPFALAMANESFCRAASAAGWKVDQEIIPYVYILDWTLLLRRSLPYHFATNIFGTILNIFTLKNRTRRMDNCFTYKTATGIDPSFDEFWDDFDKTNIIVKDRSAAVLHWRYDSLYKNKYSFFQVYKKGILSGYFIYIISEKGVCSVSDFVMKDKTDIPAAFNLFANYLKGLKRVGSVRIGINDQHPYSFNFKKIGFVKRKSEGCFMIYALDKTFFSKDFARFITKGDKDI